MSQYVKLSDIPEFCAEVEKQLKTRIIVWQYIFENQADADPGDRAINRQADDCLPYQS